MVLFWTKGINPIPGTGGMRYNMRKKKAYIFTRSKINWSTEKPGAIESPTQFCVVAE